MNISIEKAEQIVNSNLKIVEIEYRNPEVDVEGINTQIDISGSINLNKKASDVFEMIGEKLKLEIGQDFNAPSLTKDYDVKISMRYNLDKDKNINKANAIKYDFFAKQTRNTEFPEKPFISIYACSAETHSDALHAEMQQNRLTPAEISAGIDLAESIVVIASDRYEKQRPIIQ